MSSDLGEEPITWSFNLSHQGDYAVLAAEKGMQVGVDIMKTTMPGKCFGEEMVVRTERYFKICRLGRLNLYDFGGRSIIANPQTKTTETKQFFVVVLIVVIFMCF